MRRNSLGSCSLPSCSQPSSPFSAVVDKRPRRMTRNAVGLAWRRKLVSFAILDIWCLLVLLLASIWIYSSSKTPKIQPMPKDTADDTCIVYMAPSSLRGVDSMGIYTVKDLKKQSAIIGVADGLSIAVVDYNIENENATNKTRQARRNWRDLFNEYWWSRGIPDQLMWEGDRVTDMKMTFGSLPNHHCLLQSLDIHNPSKRAYNDLLVNRTIDPGVGAFSYHMGREITVKRDVKAGEELFLNYGYCEESKKHDPEWADNVLTKSDYKEAARMAVETWNNLTQHRKELRAELLDEFVSRGRKSLSASNENAASVFPTNYHELSHVMSEIPSSSTTIVAKRLAVEVGTTQRSVGWIRENGMCVDNIVPGPSSLLHSGQGAFSQRLLPKDSIIMPAPLLHITDREVLRMGKIGTDGKQLRQLLTNYCFGHDESSLVLCPITNVMLINHCSDRRRDCGAGGPNAMYRWASDWDSKTEKWLQMSIDELAQESGRGLSMEIIATRDIQPGEEVFMDYGRDWEAAWEAHMKKWKPPRDAQFLSYVSPTELNERDGPILGKLVTGDLRKTVSHPNLFTGCIFFETDFDSRPRYKVANQTWKKLDDETLLDLYSTRDGSMYSKDYEDTSDGSYWPCSVVRNDRGNSTYIVRILGSKHTRRHRAPIWYKSGLPRFVRRYPRESIRYFNIPHTSDQHLPRAFRHHVGIRDDIFPEQWKDLRKLIA